MYKGHFCSDVPPVHKITEKDETIHQEATKNCGAIDMDSIGYQIVK
jgi:hypothetical protein